MPTLRLSFSGLCTFVFDPPLQQAEAAVDRVTVLLQRLTRARPLAHQVNLQPEVLDQHFPLLEFNRADYQPASTRQADFHCFPDAAGEMTKGVCLLNGEELTILPDGQESGRGRVEFSKAPPADPASSLLSREEQESLFWMATLTDTLGTRGVINPKLLDTAPASNQPILAKAVLTQGRLKTRELTDSSYTIGGADGPSSFNRRVATSFELEVPFNNTVTIRMVANRNGIRTVRQLVLKPAFGDVLQAGVANMEIDRFIGMDPASAPRVEADFEVYADLLVRPIDRGQPRPFLRPAGPGNISAQGQSGCAPAGAPSG